MEARERGEANLLIVFNHSDLLFTDGAGSHHGLGLEVKQVKCKLLRWGGFRQRKKCGNSVIKNHLNQPLNK